MFILDLFKFNKKCQHNLIRPDMESGYCPDCGELIQNEWYITRCSCCGVKLKSISRNEKIIPQNNYCYNCGSSEFRVEKVEKINFIDINFAVLVKKIVSQTKRCSTTQCWEEKTYVQPKLLIQSL